MSVARMYTQRLISHHYSLLISHPRPTLSKAKWNNVVFIRYRTSISFHGKNTPWTIDLPTPTFSISSYTSYLLDLPASHANLTKTTGIFTNAISRMVSFTTRKIRQLFDHQIPRQICFRYPDMSIHASRVAIQKLFEGVWRDPRESTVICVNVHVPSLVGIQYSPGARRVLQVPNMNGGSSVLSEAFSVELLGRMLGSEMIKTETELLYHSAGPIMDYACRVIHNDATLGVSVTRAVAYKRPYKREDAIRLLTKKLHGIRISTENVVNTKFDRKILHVLAMSGKDASVVLRQCKRLSEQLKSNVLILVTTVNEQHIFFQSNRHLAAVQALL